MKWPFMSRLAHDEAVLELKLEHTTEMLRQRNEHDARVDRIRANHWEMLTWYAKQIDEANERTVKAMAIYQPSSRRDDPGF